MSNSTTAIKVTFADTGKTDYFGSLAAIYDHYTREDIGITLQSLWAAGLPYGNKRVNITRVIIHHKPQERRAQR